jgi:quinol monooxygenase YgiN
MSKFGLYSSLIAKAGERDTLVQILFEAAKSMRNLVDCDIYTVNVSYEEPNLVFVYEVWSNESAYQSSLLLEITQTYIQRVKPMISGIVITKSLLPPERASFL